MFVIKKAHITCININKSCNSNKCTVLSFVRTVLYIAPTCFGGIISLSSGSRHNHFFKTYNNKIDRNKHAYSVVSAVQNFTVFGLNYVHEHNIGQTVIWLALTMLKN